MIRVNIKNKITTFSGVHQTEDEANLWVKECIENNSWGLPERWVDKTDGSHTQERINAVGEVEYFFPAEYEIYPFEDITEEINKKTRYESLLKTGMNDRKCCEEIMALIGGINRTRNLTAKQITEMIKTFADIDTCLAKGRPTSAKYLITQLKIDGEILTQELYDLVMEAFKRYNI